MAVAQHRTRATCIPPIVEYAAASDRDAPRAALRLLLRLLRQRGQRARAADGARPHAGHRRHRGRGRIPRQHPGPDRRQRLQVRRPRRTRAGRPRSRSFPLPDDYRGRYRRDDPSRGARFASHVREAAERIRERRGSPAAFLCESALSCGGQIELPPGYLEAAYAHAREAGAVCIADEVQVGFGRVGTHFWAFQTQGVVPDIVTMGKPIGNGHPLAAVVTTPEIAASFANGMEYFNTFGGNPVSCRIGLAVLDVIRDEGLQERALRLGERLALGLARLSERHAIVGDVRGLGLFLGIELSLDRETRAPAAAQAAVRRRAHEGPRHPAVDRRPRPQRHQDEAAPLHHRGRRGPRDRGLRPRPVRGLREVPMKMRTLAVPAARLALAALRPCRAGRARGRPPRKTENVVVIVTDGLRWQEVFRGAETALVSTKPGGVEDEPATKKAFWRETDAAKREALMPFLWTIVAKEGQIYGNRDAGSVCAGHQRLQVLLPRLQRDRHRRARSAHRQERIRQEPQRVGLRVAQRLARAPRPGRGGRRLGRLHVIFNRERSGLDDARRVRDAVSDAPPTPGSSSSTSSTGPSRASSPTCRGTGCCRRPSSATSPPRSRACCSSGYGETDEWAHNGRYDLVPARRAQRGLLHPGALDGDAADAGVQGQDDVPDHHRSRPRRRARVLEAPRLERRGRREHVDRGPRARHARRSASAGTRRA